MKLIDLAASSTAPLHIPSAVAFELTPELALLSLLEATAAIAVRALAVAHPEIGSCDDPHEPSSCPPQFPSASACTASSLIAHLDALSFGIASYRRSRSRDMLGAAEHPDLQDEL